MTPEVVESALQIVIIMIACALVSLGATKFRALPVDILNAAIGLLFASLFSLAALDAQAHDPVSGEQRLAEVVADTAESQHAVVADSDDRTRSILSSPVTWTLLLTFFQLTTAVLVILLYRGFQWASREGGDAKHKRRPCLQGLTYGGALAVALANCYIVAVLYLHRGDIITPFADIAGEVADRLGVLLALPIMRPEVFIWILVVASFMSVLFVTIGEPADYMPSSKDGSS